ncbi:hypothetical protein BHM03_00014149 [Ensete ventricosum]|uniref:Uncharacterized protein n=1 Tax=Ensete ventricosum TaxID=4639 RepID=A0A445ME29_ENSVE|nr:hypothetical protein BHM03_00014149 [Ensete ventricosum]
MRNPVRGSYTAGGGAVIEWDLHLDRYTIVLRKGGVMIFGICRSNSIELILRFYQLAPPRFYLFLSLSFATLSLLQLLGSFTGSGLYRRHYDKTDLLLQLLDIGLEIFDEQRKLINDPPEGGHLIGGKRSQGFLTRSLRVPWRLHLLGKRIDFAWVLSSTAGSIGGCEASGHGA